MLGLELDESWLWEDDGQCVGVGAARCVSEGQDSFGRHRPVPGRADGGDVGGSRKAV